MDGIEWYAVVTKPQGETRARVILRRMGFPVFLPETRVWRRPNIYTRKKRPVKYPVMPRYVLVGLMEGGPGWLELFRCGYIRGVLGLNGRPFRIPTKDIVEMGERHGAGSFDAPDLHRWMRTHGEFSEGDEVRTVGGLLHGERFRVVGVSPAGARLTRLDGTHEILAPLECLVKAG